MKIIYVFFLLIALLPFSGCIKEVHPSIPFANQGIAISGGIFHYSNIQQDTTYYITITKTVPFTQTNIVTEDYVSDATKVEVTNGTETFNFTYNDALHCYTATIANDKILVNKVYTLTVEYDGQTYEGSDSMPSPIPIDSFKMILRTNLFGVPSNPPRYIPRLYYTLSEARNNFYYWACRYTKFFDGKMEGIDYNPNKNSNSMLYSSDQFSAKNIDSATIAGSFNPENMKDTVLFITGSQYTISNQLFNYLNILGTALGSGGPVASPPPANLKSNVHCITDPNKLVYGYFMASGADTKTINFSN